MEWVLFGAILWIAAFGMLSLWIALQKNRSPSEGFVLGAVFGPLGVLVEALLPSQTARSGVGHQGPGRIGGEATADVDLIGRRAYAVEMIRSRLDELDARWENLDYPKKRALLLNAAKGVEKALIGTGMTSTEYRHAIAEARRRLL